MTIKEIFLSTPSARRATSAARRRVRPKAISIHALREEGDTSWTTTRSLCINFYPRPPRGGRLGGLMQVLDEHIFLSTPSARRATCCRSSPCSAVGNFYPRPPRGGRPSTPRPSATAAGFLSTPSARRATEHPVAAGVIPCISIHALREEGDFQFHKSPTH